MIPHIPIGVYVVASRSSPAVSGASSAGMRRLVKEQSFAATLHQVYR